jgi:hypothetical protein
MTRVSPIIVGLAGIALALLGVAGYLMFRPHQHARTVSAEPAFVDDDGDRAMRPVAGAVTPTAAPAAGPAPAAIPPPPPAAPEPSLQQVQNAAVKKRALLMADHNQRITQEAAELAFVTLQLPDATRAAIRDINASHLKARRDFIAANPETWSPGEQQGANLAKTDENDRARRAALKAALGADGVTAFESAEHAAARRLRRQYGAQWAQELEEEAPLPEGLPPSPH